MYWNIHSRFRVFIQHLRYAKLSFAMNPGSDESSVAENVTVQQPEGTTTGSATSGDPIDQIFDRFKSYIDTKLGAFKNTFPLQDDSPDSGSKKFRREVEAK